MKMTYVPFIQGNMKGMKTIYTTRATSRIIDGSYNSIYKGRSMNFDELREYVAGDDIKDVDWNATARSQKVLVRQYIAEKKHNIMLVPHLEIELTVKREGEHDLLILIEDNGLGFKKEILDKINRNESIEEEGEHIGIQNVKERIREFYGEAYELKITSQPGYSEIRILLPRIEKQ